jgi:glycosyltransferase involved in cell wall biosynthesis
LEKTKVFIIIPSYNEAEVLATTIQGLLPLGYSIVVVDDASVDNTRDIAKEYPVYVLRHKINMGQGAALQTGITFALRHGADYFVTFDADGQHTPSDILPMLQILEEGTADIVFGSRFLSAGTMKVSFVRRMILHFARYLNFLLTGILLTDAHNGLRVFNRKSASVISIRENRMAHATELLLLVKQHGLRYKELPVQINYTPYSVKKGQKNFHSFKVLQDILLHKFFK